MHFTGGEEFLHPNGAIRPPRKWGVHCFDYIIEDQTIWPECERTKVMMINKQKA